MIYFIAILGLMLAGLGIYFFAKSWIFKNKATKSIGKVIDVQGRLGGKYKVKEYARIITFITNEGNEFKFQSELYTRSEPKIGENINVYYTLNPLYAVEEKFMTVWGMPMWLFAAGAGFIIFSLVYYKKTH